jgi:arabinogalactan oligomer/maltooligosaccharide transport system permease protein
LLAALLFNRAFVGRAFARGLLTLPWSFPDVPTVLVFVWILNPQFGVMNVFARLLPWIQQNQRWLLNADLAMLSIVVISAWKAFPFYSLVILAALQTVPSELTEAARVDGGGAWQIFRRVTLPLLLVAVAPLMIASFAFNFNNFNNIYLMTQGGPYTGASSIAGNTDILISYTYKVAIASGTGGNYALASAFAIIIFFVVAAISGVSFWRTKSLETLR